MKQLYALTFLLLLACQTAPEIITIGVVGPLSTESGRDTVKGIELAKRELMLPDVAVTYVDVACERISSEALARVTTSQAIINLCSGVSLPLDNMEVIDIALAEGAVTLELNEAYLATHGVEPTTASAQGYNAFKKLAQTIG